MPLSPRIVFSRGALLALALCLFGGGVLLGRSGRAAAPLASPLGTSTTTGRVLGQGQAPRLTLSEDVDFALFWETWQTLRSKYYDQPVDDKTLFYGALSGLVAGAGDPYTAFFPPSDAEEFTRQLEGRFEGIGAQIEVKEGRLLVVAPLVGSPAEKAGLRPGDWLVKIDETPTDGLTVDKAAERIRGPKGTAVTLVVVRAGPRAEPFPLTIIRDQIQVKSVKLSWKGDLAVLEISGFNGDTPDLFARAVDEIRAKKAKGVVLDLRNNPGGSVLSAQVVAGAWIGEQVAFKERRQGKIVDSVRGIGNGELGAVPTAVLVNRGSASASEIVAGALQDYGKATVIGTTTFGKGSVQEYEELKDGSALKVTIAEWLTPKDRAINHVGLEPTLSVERTEADYEAKRDPQFDRAQQLLEGRAPTPGAATTTRP